VRERVIITRKTSPEKMLAILAAKTTTPVLLREIWPATVGPALDLRHDKGMRQSGESSWQGASQIIKGQAEGGDEEGSRRR